MAMGVVQSQAKDNQMDGLTIKARRRPGKALPRSQGRFGPGIHQIGAFALWSCGGINACYSRNFVPVGLDIDRN